MGGSKQRPRRELLLPDSDSEEEEVQLTEAAYMASGVAAALQRGEDYCAATQELSQLLQQGVYGSRCSKGAQAAIVKDLARAIACVTW